MKRKLILAAIIAALTVTLCGCEKDIVDQSDLTLCLPTTTSSKMAWDAYTNSIFFTQGDRAVVDGIERELYVPTRYSRTATVLGVSRGNDVYYPAKCVNVNVFGSENRRDIIITANIPSMQHPVPSTSHKMIYNVYHGSAYSGTVVNLRTMLATSTLRMLISSSWLSNLDPSANCLYVDSIMMSSTSPICGIASPRGNQLCPTDSRKTSIMLVLPAGTRLSPDIEDLDIGTFTHTYSFPNSTLTIYYHTNAISGDTTINYTPTADPTYTHYKYRIEL